MDIDYCGITAEIRSIPVVYPQQATSSLQYYHKFHLLNCGIPAVFLSSPVRKENVVALQRAEMRMVRWMCGVKTPK